MEVIDQCQNCVDCVTIFFVIACCFIFDWRCCIGDVS